MASRYSSLASFTSECSTGTVYAPPIALWADPRFPDPEALEAREGSIHTREAEVAESVQPEITALLPDPGAEDDGTSDPREDKSVGRTLSSSKTLVDSLDETPDPVTRALKGMEGTESVLKPAPTLDVLPETYVDIMYAVSAQSLRTQSRALIPFAKNGGKPVECWTEGRIANDIRSWLAKVSGSRPEQDAAERIFSRLRPHGS
jgi:hypothetical protein